MDRIGLLEPPAAQISYAVEYSSGKKELYGDAPPLFKISVPDRHTLQQVLHGSAYRAALAFIDGRVDVAGDLTAALRLRRESARAGWLDGLAALLARIAPSRLETWFQGRKRAAHNIRFHYDVSNEFYATFLDRRLVYSAAYFKNAGWSLEQAQEAKLEAICSHLNLHQRDRFLDVGCGWGALLIYAAQQFGVHGLGCTLSRRQYEFAGQAIQMQGLERFATVMETDYRDLTGRFDKIASVGMFEHVGRHRLGNYFRKIYSLLEDGGLFFNSGIIRPPKSRDDPETRFLQKHVFPGGELEHLSDVVGAAGKAGFSVIEIHSLRKHYARTCHEWVERLQQRRRSCLSLVGDRLYRTWLLYLAASAVSFDTGRTGAYSILMSKG